LLLSRVVADIRGWWTIPIFRAVICPLDQPGGGKKVW
jgi:hypothetical protein